MTTKTTLAEETFEDIAARVDKAFENVNKLEDVNAQTHALGLKTAIEDLNKFGLVKIVQKLKSDERGKELLFELLDEQSVRSLFTLHGIIKQDISAKILQVLEYVKPYMQSHGGDVEFVKFEEGTAFVRLLGSCNGCSQSAVTLREGVEEALVEHIPEIKNVEVVPNEPSPSLIQIESRNTNKKGWIETLSVEDVPAGKMKCFEGETDNILIINIDNNLSAFRNECPHQGLPLNTGYFDAEDHLLTCGGHGFKFDAVSGECITAPQAQLEAFPLRIEDGKILVRPN